MKVGKFYWQLGPLGLALAMTGNAQIAGVEYPPSKGDTPPQATRLSPQQYSEYLRAIELTAGMVSDRNAQAYARRQGLNVLNLTWEDTGRYKNSSVGPNISDMTIQVAVKEPRSGQTRISLMPVIRYPNFSDLTCDLDPRAFTLLVGNEHGRPLRRISLYDFLVQPDRYLTRPNSWPAKHTLVAPRDYRVLVSAQACFLPVPRSGIATFNPVVFNYQSVKGDPAVLTILATREGTSTTVIDNHRDAFDTGWNWGQRLFFNDKGMRASLTGQRLSDVGPSAERGTAGPWAPDMVLLIQVPLKQKSPGRAPMPLMEAASAGAMEFKSRSSDVERAVIGHGEWEGHFIEMDDLPVERDPRFPIRVTVQFYKATSNGVVSESDIRQIKSDIDRVYRTSDSVGSLVTGGSTGRITEYDGVKVMPRDWWEMFWARYELDTGVTRDEALRRLITLLGKEYWKRPVCELYVRDLLRQAPKP